MPQLIFPLTDVQIKNAKPKVKSYKLADGGGFYREITPPGSKLCRMKFKQASGKENGLSFGIYPDVSLTQARAARAAARQLRATDIDPGQAKRDAKLAKAAAAALGGLLGQAARRRRGNAGPGERSGARRRCAHGHDQECLKFQQVDEQRRGTGVAETEDDGHTVLLPAPS